MATLEGKRVAILATDGFEESELMEPRRRLGEAGAQVDVVSPKETRIRAWRHTDWSGHVPVDIPLSQADPGNYDALVLPGGQINPDLLRTDADAVAFARRCVDEGKTVAAICHGPWLLVEADRVRNKRATSYHSIRTDMVNAGAQWADESVIEDGNLITSRNPGDLDAFCGRIIERLSGDSRRATQ